MFTGLIKNKGKILELKPGPSGAFLKIASDKIEADWEIGESIAVNGCCLSLKSFEGANLSFDLSPETLEKTTFKNLKTGAPLHLERSLKLSDRMGGHFVQGHVDGLGEILKIEKNSEFWTMEVRVASSLLDLMVEKGSVAVDGVSLTINLIDQANSSFRICLIPETLRETNLNTLELHSRVNIEIDMMAKLISQSVERILMRRSS